MQYITLTDKGILRSNNEDNCRAAQIGEFTLLVLADGMGGANCGEVASEKAIETVFSCFDEVFVKNLSRAQLPRALTTAMDKANKLLYSMARSEKKYEGMGTTLDICIVSGSTVYIAHIGDSRVYKVTATGEITRLTKDHSLVEYMIETGAITPEEALTHPQKNIITKAVGTTPFIEPDILSYSLDDGDRLLMCSDGLTNMVDEKKIASVITSEANLSTASKALIDLANEAGGTDNITVIIAHN